MNILITAGATQEPIDQVRFITNFSTGSTSAAIAEGFAQQGHKISYLRGIGAVSPRRSAQVTELEFSDFRDLESKLREQLASGDFDAVIHAAAVSDYSVASVEIDGITRLPENLPKIDSGAGEVVLRLKRNYKLLDRLKTYSSRPDLKVVGFKLTHTPKLPERLAAVRALVSKGQVDWVVHNDYGEIREGQRRFTLFRTSREGVTPDGAFESREALAAGIENRLKSARDS